MPSCSQSVPSPSMEMDSGSSGSAKLLKNSSLSAEETEDEGVGRLAVEADDGFLDMTGSENPNKDSFRGVSFSSNGKGNQSRGQ